MFSGVSWRQTGVLLVTAVGVFSLVFLAAPEIDIWFSGLFYSGADGFHHAENFVFRFIRYVFMYGLSLLALAVFALFIRAAFIGSSRAISLNLWGFMVASFLAGPIGLVNGILKSYWGRARPAYIEDFGGDKTFTPPYYITDQCQTNCSFVSGEGAAIATALIVLGIVLWPNLNTRWRRIGVYFVLPFSVFGIALRIITGRHFLSDTIFAALFCALIIWAFYRVFHIAKHRHELSWANFRKDFLTKRR